MATKSRRSTRKSGGKVSAGGGLKSAIVKGSKALGGIGGIGGGGGRGGGGRRRHGVEYWAKKVLVERLKKKYFKAKYGSVR